MTRSSRKISRIIKLAKHTVRIKRADGGETDLMLDSDVKNTEITENPYKDQVVKPYDPTVRDRLAASILDLVPRGEHTPEALKQFVSNTLGSLGAGHTGLSLVDLTPVGGAMGAQEAAREGDYKGAAMAMLPGAPALRAESRALKVAEKYDPHLPSIEVRAPDPYVKGVNDPKPELQQAIKDFYAGKLTREDYDNVVRRAAPVEPYDFIPQPSPEHLAVDALNAAKKDKYAMNRDIYQEGDPVSLRLDIPAYTNLPNSQWVNSIHDTRGVHPTTYDSVSAARNVDFVVPETKARMTGEGGPKAPYAVMRGEYVPINADDAVAKAREIMGGPLPSQWQQVGMDPRRHSYFYTRDERMIPVTNADEVLQIGPVVYAKNPKTGQREDFGYADGGRVGFADGGAPWDVDLSGSSFSYDPTQGSNVPLANMDLYKGAPLNAVPDVTTPPKADTTIGPDTIIQPEGSGGGNGSNGLATTTTSPGPAPSPELAQAPSPSAATTPGIGGFLSGKVQSALNNPLSTAVNAAVGFVPGVGLVNTLSGILGGPTVGGMISPGKDKAAPEKVTPGKISASDEDVAAAQNGMTGGGSGAFGGGGLNTSISDATGLSSEGGGGTGGSGGAGAGGSGGAGVGGTGGAGVGGGGPGVGETGGPGGPDGGDRGGGDNSGGGSGSGSGGSGGSGGAGGGGSGSTGGGTGGGSSEGNSNGEGSSGGTGDGTGEGSGSGQGGNGDGGAGVKRGGAITLHRYSKSKGPIDLTGRNDRSTKRVAIKKTMPPNALINKALGVVSKKT